MTRLVAVYFDQPGGLYGRMARVLDYTARKHNPEWQVDVLAIAPSRLQARRPAYADNSWKLEHWVQAVVQAPNGARVLLMDADTFVLGPLDGIFEGAWDVAVTARAQGCRYPVNAGVVAVQVGPKARAFMESWLRIDRRILVNPVEHALYVKAFGGHNQTSLGILRAGGSAGARVVEVPGLQWNCEDTLWKHFSPQVTRVVHVKSALRMAVGGLNAGAAHAVVAPLARAWGALEREAVAQAGA